MSNSSDPADDPVGHAALVAAELAVRELSARYCMAVDDGRFEEFAELYEPDAVLHVMGGSHRGRDSIREFMSAAQSPELRGRHTTSSHVTTLDVAAGTGSGWVDYVFFDADGHATNLGRYHDRYVRGADGRWRFAVREIVFRGAKPELTEPWA
ncbi:MAG: nuclear transport factor 2 family protein [Actinomycetia bacterium]|nr:nuclear transport factor 2 family protein [Actinomycetes bacterium]